LKRVVAAALALGLATTPVAEATTDRECLATAIYRESRGEPVRGRRAVYDVVLNRVADRRGKKARVCAVLRERGQFPWAARQGMMRMNNNLQKMLTEVEQHDKVLTNEKYFNSVKPKERGMKCQKISKQYFCSKTVRKHH
jgi:spore germination cell wall hydrolase CwlJ-like protein